MIFSKIYKIHAITYTLTTTLVLLLFVHSVSPAQEKNNSDNALLRAVPDKQTGQISIYRNEESEPIIIQNAKKNIRPYIHPIKAPMGKGVFTQNRPAHHPHQTGLYWGFKKLNGRDYFMACCKPGLTGFYRRISFDVVKKQGKKVQWQTVYNLLNKKGEAILTETHTWSLQQINREFVLDLEWKGTAIQKITIEKYFVGGLFLRMPWHEGVGGKAINASGQTNAEAEAQRSIWLDTGMEIDGRSDWGHIVIFDHPSNTGFPTSWRVDNELGIGPSRQIMGKWSIEKGDTETIRYRLIIYTGELTTEQINKRWTRFMIDY